MINFSSVEHGHLPRLLAHGARYLSVFSGEDSVIYPNEVKNIPLNCSLEHSEKYTVIVLPNPLILSRNLMVLNSVLYPSAKTTIMVKNCNVDKIILRKYSPIANIFIVMDSTMELIHSGVVKFEVINGAD